MQIIWIIDGEQWPRALLRAELVERGYDAVGFLTVRDAIDQLPWRRPDAIVVELRGQPAQQVERLTRIGVPVIVTGGASDLEELEASLFTAVLPRPVSLGTIADRVIAAIRERAQRPSPE
jgi:DNA-binding NtrC family response regulator